MKYDVVTAIDVGKRPYQEDAVAVDFSLGSPFGFAVLSDGMGGHAAGDVASKIIVTEVFSELKLQIGDVTSLEDDVAELMRGAAAGANACIGAHVAQNASLRGMGATLLAIVVFGDRLHWISIGDSPLFLYRADSIRQLNDDHSLAPQIDMMVKTGQMDAESGRNHPDRNSLTSVVMGRAITEIDCPDKPLTMERGDILIAASDGLQFLNDDQIAAALKKSAKRSSADIAEALMAAVARLGDPDQDNVSFAIIKFC
jgi:serine/threonine protein phosphatase PrpC